MAQVKQTIGRPTAEMSGKTYFEEIINSRENQAMKSRNSDMADFDGLMNMAIIGQRALLEQETAKVLIYDYHDYRFFHLFVDGKYVQGLVPF